MHAIKENLGLIFLLILAAALILAPLLAIVFTRRQNKKILQSWDEHPFEEPVLTEIRGQIISKEYRETYHGIKLPRFEAIFEITFRDIFGKDTVYTVPEEIFFTLEEGQTGTLAAINGKFYGFSPDETD